MIARSPEAAALLEERLFEPDIARSEARASRPRARASSSRAGSGTSSRSSCERVRARCRAAPGEIAAMAWTMPLRLDSVNADGDSHMAGEAQRRPTTRLRRTRIGERLAGFIYGTIIVLAVLVGGSRAFPDDAGHIAALVVVTSVVFWLAHVYAHGLAHSVIHDEHLSLAELRGIARREGSIVGAAVPPLAALLLGAVGAVSTKNRRLGRVRSSDWRCSPRRAWSSPASSGSAGRPRSWSWLRTSASASSSSV